MEDKEILTEVTKYLDYLETPSDNFGGMPVCPFLKKERVTENLMLEKYRIDFKKIPMPNYIYHVPSLQLNSLEVQVFKLRRILRDEYFS